MVIDLGRARAWRRLQDELADLAGRIGRYRSILAPSSAGYRLASDLLAIAGALGRVLRGAVLGGADTRLHLLDVKIRILALAERPALDRPCRGLAAALLDHAGGALALFLAQRAAA